MKGNAGDKITLRSLRRLTIQPGDVLVVSVKQRITEVAGARIKESFEGIFPGQKIIVLDDGVELATVRPKVTGRKTK